MPGHYFGNSAVNLENTNLCPTYSITADVNEFFIRLHGNHGVKNGYTMNIEEIENAVEPQHILPA